MTSIAFDFSRHMHTVGKRWNAWRAACLLLAVTASAQHTKKEAFAENVSLRTLPDGRVATTFTFTTVLNDATPRDPRTLASDDDECACASAAVRPPL